MATYDLEEQEQLDNLKAWWNQYGNLITTVVIVVSAAVLAYQGWQWYQRNQAGKAAGIYIALQQAVRVGDAARIKETAGDLVENYGRTPYAALAALTAAKLAVDGGDLKSAQVQLQWVADHGKDELREIGRLRLAAVLLDQKQFDAAQKQVESASQAAFAPRFAEMKGDILLAQGKSDEAKAAYKSALTQLDAASKDAGKEEKAMDQTRESLQQKIDALGGDSK